MRPHLHLADRYRRMTMGISLTLLVAIGALVAPLPTPSSPETEPTPGSLWAQGIQNLTSLTSYRLTYTTSVPTLDLAGFSITVGPPGSWYGTVTDSMAPSSPLTMADEDGILYVKGGPDLAAPALAAWFSVTPAQAEALGGRWLNCDSIPYGNEGNVLEPQIALYTNPVGLAINLPLPLVTPSATPTTIDGQAGFQLSADGTVMLVTRGGHPSELNINGASDHYTLGALNHPVTPPDVSGAVTWSELTGGSSPPP